MSARTTVRRRRDQDIPALTETLGRVHARDGYPVEGISDPLALLKPPGELASWVAEISGMPIGQVSLTRARAGDDAAKLWGADTGADLARLALLARLFVDPKHRSCGAGRHLVQAAVQYAQACGLAVALDVMDKDRAAIRLYERMGARRLGSITHHHSGDLTEPAAVYAFNARA